MISLEDKAKILKGIVFSKPIEVDLSDIANYSYPIPLEIEDKLTIEEILAIYLRLKPNKALGPDNIPNRIIYILVRSRIILLERLFQAY